VDVTKCIALALEEECDDLVSAIGGGSSLECHGSLIVLAS
jgi:alcohol dehydrogenase class IV